MRIQTEDVALVEAYALENAIAVEQTVVEHGNFCINLIDELAIQINLHRVLELAGAGNIVQH